MRYSLAFAASVSILARVHASPVETVKVVSQAPPALATASLTAGTETKSSLVHAAAHANAVSPVPATAPGQYDDLFLCYGQNCRGGCQVVQLAQLKALTCYTSPLVSLAFASVQWPVTGSPAYKVDVSYGSNCGSYVTIPAPMNCYNLYGPSGAQGGFDSFFLEF